MSAAFLERLVSRCPSVREIWLIGSRANGSARTTSDWDYIVFADQAALSQLKQDPSLNEPGIDLLVVYDGDNFEEPWPEADRTKHGCLSGWQWRVGSPTEAVYRATKPRAGADFAVEVRQQTARRVWTSSAT